VRHGRKRSAGGGFESVGMYQGADVALARVRERADRRNTRMTDGECDPWKRVQAESRGRASS
jgi:hypothetical protein